MIIHFQLGKLKGTIAILLKGEKVEDQTGENNASLLAKVEMPMEN